MQCPLCSCRSDGRALQELAGVGSPRADGSCARPQRLVQHPCQLSVVAAPVPRDSYTYIRRSGSFAPLRAGRSSPPARGRIAHGISPRLQVPLVRERRHQSGALVPQIHAEPNQYVVQGLVDIPVLLLHYPPLAALLQRVHTSAHQTRVSKHSSSWLLNGMLSMDLHWLLTTLSSRHSYLFDRTSVFTHVL